MGMHTTRLRGALAVLLAGSAILFLVGSTIERNNRHHEATPAHTEGSGGETGGEGSHTGETPAPTAAPTAEAGSVILGVDTESLALSIVAVVLSFLLAAAIWIGRGRRLLQLAAVGFGLVFAAGDGRELVHQLDDSNGGLAAVAGLLIALHLGVVALAGLLLRPRPGAPTAVAEAA